MRRAHATNLLNRLPCDIREKIEHDGPWVQTFDEQIHDYKSHEAAAINNAGPTAQIGYLRQHCGYTWDRIREALGINNEGGRP